MMHSYYTKIINKTQVILFNCCYLLKNLVPSKEECPSNLKRYTQWITNILSIEYVEIQKMNK